jgi:peroxiredoxin
MSSKWKTKAKFWLMDKKVFLFFLLFFFSRFVFSAVIEGQNKAYAGKKLSFYSFSDPVAKEEKLLFTLNFDGEGRFKTDVNVAKTTFAFCEFGIFRGQFFLEPGKNINLLFPPFQEKSFSDQKNPFFEPIVFWFMIQGDNGLNSKISGFETQFSQLTGKYFNELYFRQSKEKYDSVGILINQSFPKSEIPVFETHKNLTLEMLQAEAFRIEPKNSAKMLAAISEDFWNHPAFIALFDKSFSGRLSFDVKEIQGDQIRKAVAQANIGFLLEHVSKNYQVTGKMAELALLKMLHDGFYSGDFSKNSILQLLETDKLKNNTNKTIRETTLNISKKLSFLQPGSKAPVICLKDINGNRKCTDANSGKFKYIVFADNEMVVCQEHLKYLTRINELFQKNLEIILVMRRTDIIEMKIFLDKNNIPGLQLVDESGEFTRNYNVKSFPTCLLFDENHKVVYENVKAPLDGFEQQFGSFLQKELFERQRNQPR